MRLQTRFVILLNQKFDVEVLMNFLRVLNTLINRLWMCNLWFNLRLRLSRSLFWSILVVRKLLLLLFVITGEKVRDLYFLNHLLWLKDGIWILFLRGSRWWLEHRLLIAILMWVTKLRRFHFCHLGVESSEVKCLTYYILALFLLQFVEFLNVSDEQVNYRF